MSSYSRFTSDYKFEERLDFLYDCWHIFTEVFGVNTNRINISHPILMDILRSYFRDVERIKHFHGGIQRVDESKIAGYLSYWIVKFRPIQLFPNISDLSVFEYYINESFAFAVSVSRFYGVDVKPISENFYNDVLYYCRYRILTGDSLFLMFKAISS